MPKLQIFAPCQQVILGQDGSASLIVVITEFMFPPLPVELPPNAAVPAKWHVFSQWAREPGEENKTFFQEIRLVNCDGKDVQDPHEQPFRMTAHFNRMNAVYTAFPILQPADYDLVVSLRKENETMRSEVGRYTFSVVQSAETPP